MKKITFLIFFLLSILVSFAQETGEVLPKSWELNLQNRISPIELPPLDLSYVQQEDSINDKDKTLPWRYGITREVILDFQNVGVWTELPHGGRIWQVAIHSPRALNLSVNFNDFYLPEGATLHLYNEDYSDISRTYTKTENRNSNLLGSWFIKGETIFVEYYEPANVPENAVLKIGSVIHGYRMGEVTRLVNELRGLNDSGDCNYDVNCPVGADFDSKKDIVKKAVALLNLGNGYLCSAALVNNTNGDKTPYLLTANHCLQNSNPALWSVRFNWMSPSPICGSGEDSPDLQTNFTMSGGDLRANNAQSDFALVELYNAIPNSWDVSFAGWDNSDTNPIFEIGIHHPNGDIMKICRDDSGAVKDNANGTQVWLIGGTSVGSGNGWEMGTTESGSSGSPLFNENGRIIGQLYAGQSFCDGTQNNNEYDIYGRFGVSWNSGNVPENRLMDWLDPSGTGVTNIEALQNILNVPNFQQNGSLEIYPNPASTIINIINSRYPKLQYGLYNLLGQRLMGGSMPNTMNTINVEGYAKGVYFLHLVDDESKAEVTKKIIISQN